MGETHAHSGSDSKVEHAPWQFGLGGLLLLMTGFALWMSLIGRVAFRQGGASALLASVPHFVLMSAWIAGMWRTFAKAGQPGWGAIVPIYNLVLLARLAGWSSWEAIFLIIPVLNYVAWFIVCVQVAHRFGKGKLFGIGLAVLPHVFFFLLGFGAAQYDPSRLESV